MNAAEIAILAQDDIPAALRAVEQALTDPTTPLDQFAAVALEGARLTAQTGDWILCRRLADRGRQAALEADLGADLLGAIAACQGAAAVHQGDTATAVEYLAEALSMAEASPAVAERRGRILYNLAIARVQQRNYTEAVMLYDQASVEFQKQGLGKLALSARLEAVWALGMAGGTPEAKERLQQAEVGLAEYPDLKPVSQLYTADLALQDGDLELAKSSATSVLQIPGADPDHMAEAIVVLGRVALRQGARHEAARSAEEALAMAERGSLYSGLLRRIQELRSAAGGE